MPRCTQPCTVRGSTLAKRAKSSTSKNSICLSSRQPRGPDVICRYIALRPTPRNALIRAFSRSLRPEGLSANRSEISCGPSSRSDCRPSSISLIRLSLRLMWHHLVPLAVRYSCGWGMRFVFPRQASEPSHYSTDISFFSCSYSEQHYSARMVFVYTFI